MSFPISTLVKTRMDELEQIDARDRLDGTPRSKRLRQITPDAGWLLALLVANAPEGLIVELGTSAGYSTLWIYLGAQRRDQGLITFEVDPDKAELARETFEQAQVGVQVDLRVEDALRGVQELESIGFAFLDLDKRFYLQAYDLIVPRLVEGGLLVADNAISHGEALAPFLDEVHQDPRVDAMVLPVGRGELICRRKGN